MIKKSIFVVCALLFTLCGSANSAIIYMGPTETYTNLQSAMSAMSAGDTLIIRDGTYTGDSNTIDYLHVPPTALGTWTTIQAENPGSVVFDGEYERNMFYVDGNNAGNLHYIHFDGIIWKNSSTQGCVTLLGISGTYNEYVYFSRCGFSDAGINQSTSYNGIYLRWINHGLIEDCYSWGELYYGLIYEQCTNSIMRRCVSRFDIHRGPLGGACAVYSSSDIELQNCIAIDCDRDAAYTDLTEGLKGFFYPTTDGPSTNIYTRGCIALNLNADGKIYSGMTSANGGGSNFVFENFVAYDTSGGFWDRISGNTYINSVFAESAGSVISEGIAGSGTLTYSLIFGNAVRGSNVSTANYNDYYDNGTDGNTGTGNVTINPLTNGYLYLPRIEAESALSGYSMGPDITKRIGVSGSFYGETGYNTVTTEELWPWPNEALIREKFSEYNGNSNATVSGDRGFASTTAKQLDGVSDVTLTSYIWEYLGNQIPADIYGTGTTRYYLDADSDGYSSGDYQDAESDPGATWYTGSELTSIILVDCDDSNTAINPGATEICGNEVDEDCDGAAQTCQSITVTTVGNVIIQRIIFE